MKDIKIFIPSLGRSKQKESPSVGTLIIEGFGKDTYLLVEEREYEDYKKTYKNAINIIKCKDKTSCMYKKNKAIKYANKKGFKRIIFMEDDLSRVNTRVENKKIEESSLTDLFEQMLKSMKEENLVVCGPRFNYMATEKKDEELFKINTKILSDIVCIDLSKWKDIKFPKEWEGCDDLALCIYG